MKPQAPEGCCFPEDEVSDGTPVRKSLRAAGGRVKRQAGVLERAARDAAAAMAAAAPGGAIRQQQQQRASSSSAPCLATAVARGAARSAVYVEAAFPEPGSSANGGDDDDDGWCACELRRCAVGGQLCLVVRRADGRTRWCFHGALRRPRLRRAPCARALGAIGFGDGKQSGHGGGGFIFEHSRDGLDENLLVLLHGLGDGPAPFSTLARTMALPQTATLALRAPCGLPCGLGGHSWFPAFEEDGTLITATRSEQRRATGLGLAAAAVLGALRTLWGGGGATADAAAVADGGGGGGGGGDAAAVQAALAGVLGCGRWAPERIFLLGFSQGGTVALEVARVMAAEVGSESLGGVLALSASMLPEVLAAEEEQQPSSPPPPPLPLEQQQQQQQQQQQGRSVPVLLLHGEFDPTVPSPHVHRTEALLQQAPSSFEVQRHEVAGKRVHAMASSAAEMQVLFAFIAQRLRSRQWALEAAGDCASWHEVPSS